MKKLISSLRCPTRYSGTLMLIYAMNITDYLFTLILVSGGIFPVNAPFPLGSAGALTDLAAKCLLPLLLLLGLRMLLGMSEPKHPKLIGFFLESIAAYYFILNVFHLIRLCYILFLF